MTNNPNLELKVELTSPVIETEIHENATIVAQMTTGGRGKSAYEVWLSDGHAGSVSDFLAWLRATNYYIHEQGFSSTTWNINHGLGKYPSVTVVDSGGNWMIGEVYYKNENEIILRFTYEFSGKAYLN